MRLNLVFDIASIFTASKNVGDDDFCVSSTILAMKKENMSMPTWEGLC